MELELKEYFSVIKKRMWIIIAFVLVACLTTGIISYYLIKPVYEASTKLIVNKSGNFQGLDKIDINTLTTNIRLINTYKEIIKTPAILDKVAAKYQDLNLNTQQLNEKIKVASSNDSQIMTITVQDFSQEKAAKIVNAVAAVFQEEIPSIMKVDNVAILNEAKPENRPTPVKPNPILNIVIAFVVSLMLSVGIVFLLEYLDDTIKSEKEIEIYLGVPTLATIMKIKQDDLKTKTLTASQKMVGETAYASINQ